MQIALSSSGGFADCAADWDALNDGYFQLPILSSTFVKLLLAHFGNPDLRLLIVRNAERPLLMAVLEQRRFGILSTWQPSQAPLGLVVYDRGVPLAGLVQAVFREFKFAPMLDLLQQDSRFAGASPSAPHCDSSHYIDTPWIDCTQSFAEYWSALGKNIKKNIKKDLNKLEKKGIAPELREIGEAAAVAAAIRGHAELEASGWKHKLHTAITADGAQGRFYRELLEHYCGRGHGAVFQYYYGDQLVASDFGIATEQCFVVLKTAFRETVDDSSPAQLLRYGYFPLLFARFQGGRIEFYGKALDWHMRWTKHVRAIEHHTYYRGPALQTLGAWWRKLRGSAVPAAASVTPSADSAVDTA